MTARATPFRNGFTLIELMMTLAVLAVILGLAVPSFQNFVKNQRVRNTSFELNSALTQARSEATKRNADVTVTQVGASWADGWTITSAGLADPLMSHDPVNNIAITANTASVTFRHNGRLLLPVGGALPTFNLDVSPASSGVTPRCLSLDLGGKVSNEC